MGKLRTYKGKPHNSYVKPFKRKYKGDRGRVKKCKCFIYGKEGHFAKDYRSKQGNIVRSAVFQELDLDDNWDIVSIDFNYSSVYSISEGEVNVKRKLPHKPEEEKDYSSNEVRLLKELLKEKTEQEEFPPLGNSQIARPFIEAEAHHFGNTAAVLKVKKVTNQLYNVKVEFEISSCPAFRTTAIIDTGASTFCINKRVVPKEALEPLTQIVFFNGLNSRHQATHRLKQGSFLIKGNKFKIPLIYAFNMHDSNDIEILIGSNFLRSMKGEIRIEGDEITTYKKGTTIDPVTGKEIKGKERMNAPAVFQKMDKCFKGTESFIAVYIDDILVFSKNEKEHVKHLERMLKIYEDNGLVLSPTKMKIAVPTIDFLGAVIGEGAIKLQPHIIKKIMSFNEEELKIKKGLRSFLGILYYASNHIPKLGILLRPLMHRINEAINSNISLLSGGSSTIPLCLSKEYEEHLRRSHEDFQPLPRIFTRNIFTHEEPRVLYRHYQLTANQTPIRMDKSDAWRTTTQDIELSAAKEAVKAMRNLQALI
ncbi:Orf y [Tanacetum coccineum]